MRILHVVQGYTPAIGGTERLIQKVSEKLVERHGDDVTVFTTNAYNCELFWRRDQPQMPVGVEQINGVTVRRFPVFNRFNKLRYLAAGFTYKYGLPYNDWFRAFYNGPLIPGMTKQIREFGADVIAGSSFPLLHMHYMQLAGKQANVPVVFYGGIHTADTFGFERPMIYKAIKQVDAYVAYTSFERDYLIGRGISAAKIGITGVGVDPEPFVGADETVIRQKYGWGAAPVIGFIGQQVPHKGIDMIMAAMSAVWEENPETCLLIAGSETTYSAVISDWVAHLTPEQRARVAIINNFSEAEKPAIFAACDMVLYPSGHESFGIVFLEAWASGKPVVGARIGAIPTVIDEGKDGLLITHRNTGDLIEAILTLLNQPDLAFRLGAAGHKKVLQQYTWDIVADKFRDIYLQVRLPSH